MNSFRLIVILIAALGVSACAGGKSNQITNVKTTTTGQELEDLKKALDSGAITQKEYDKTRKVILKG